MTRKNNGPPVVIEQPHLMLVPAGAWWTAVFNAAPAPTEIYCDICTPPSWPHPSEVTMVDLDLDVVRRAEESAAWLLATIAAGAQPFAGHYLTWFDQVQ